MTEQNLKSFDEYVRLKCQALLEDIDNWLNKLDEPDAKKGDKVIHTGVGIYHFVVKDEAENVRMKDLLENRSEAE